MEVTDDLIKWPTWLRQEGEPPPDPVRAVLEAARGRYQLLQIEQAAMAGMPRGMPVEGKRTLTMNDMERRARDKRIAETISVPELFRMFPDEETCIRLFEQARWNGIPTCPYYGSQDDISDPPSKPD